MNMQRSHILELYEFKLGHKAREAAKKTFVKRKRKA